MSAPAAAPPGPGRTKTAPARAPDGFPFGFPRYRSYVLFAATSIAMAIAAIGLLLGLAALGGGEDAWRNYLAGFSSVPVIMLSLIVLGFTVFFALRFAWVGRKIAAGRIGPIPGPPLPLPLLGVAPIGGFVVAWLLILAILGGAFS